MLRLTTAKVKGHLTGMCEKINAETHTHTGSYTHINEGVLIVELVVPAPINIIT